LCVDTIVCPSNRSIVRAIAATASSSALQCKSVFSSTSQVVTLSAHPFFFSLIRRICKKKKPTKLWGVYLSIFLRSIKMCKKSLSTPDVRLTSIQTMLRSNPFYVTSTKIVVVKVDSSVVNLMVPCQKKVEKKSA